MPQALQPQTVAQPAEVGQQQPVRDGGEFCGERSKVQRVRLACSCRPWDYLLESVDAFKYLKGILLLYFLYQDYKLNLAEATKPMVLFGMVYVLAEGIVVGCWGLFLSLCRSR